MAKINKSENPNAEPMGFSDMRNKYQSWVLGLSPKAQKSYGIFALLSILALPTIATVLEVLFNLPRPFQVVLGFPAGIALFLLILGFFTVHARKNPGRKTLKEKFSAMQRIKWSIIGGIAILGLIVSASGFIPYAFGGVIVLAAALGVYNFIQRTPIEIEYYDNGVIDPRDEEAMNRAAERSRKTNNRKKKVKDDE